LNILVDTSVWSLALRRKSAVKSIEAQHLEKLLLSGETVQITGIILQEILQGIRANDQVAKLIAYFHSFPLISPSRDNYIYAASLYNTCRRSGIQASTVDCLIASIAIRHECYLFTTDGDFLHIQNIAPLKLLDVN
jgi:predicted nucleic acid-binding protein